MAKTVKKPAAKAAKKEAKPAKKTLVKVAPVRVEPVIEQEEETQEEQSLEFQFGAGEQAMRERANQEFDEAEGSEILGFDIFKHGWEVCQAKGDIPKFKILRDSELIATVKWPFTWEQVQKRYGYGHFQVIATSTKTGQYIKSQTELIGDPHRHDDNVDEDTQQTQAAGQQPMDLMSMLALLKEKENTGANAMTTMMTVMMQSQQQSQQQNQLMMMEMQKLSQAQITAAQSQAAAANNQMLTLLTTLLSKKDDTPKGIDQLGILKLIQDARKEAKDDERRFQEILDKKVERAREEAASGSDDEPKSESLMTTVLKGLVPMLPQLAAAQQQQQQQGGAPQIAQLTPEQQNDLILQRQREQREFNLREQKRRTEIEQARAKKIAARRGQVAQNVPQNFVEGETGPQASADSGRKVVANIEVQNAIINIVKPEIEAGVINFGTQTAAQTARIAVEKLAQNGITRQTVVDQFKFGDLVGVAKAYGVPVGTEIVDAWLKEFYEELERDPAAAAAASEPAAGAVIDARTVVAPPAGAIPVVGKANAARSTSARTSPREPAQNL